jgi:ribosomal protein L12E/L44/L45/RPP1/RPP2
MSGSWSDTLAAYNAASVAAAAASAAAGQRPRGTNHMTATYPPIETERKEKNKDEEKGKNRWCAQRFT